MEQVYLPEKRVYYKKINLGGAARKDEHRLIIEKCLGRKLRRDEIVHHIDGNKKNNNLSNLELMSLSEHSRMHRLGKKGPTMSEEQKKRLSIMNSGENSHTAVLKQWEVDDIRARLKRGCGVRCLGREFGVAHSAISRIKLNKAWKK